VSGGCSFQFHVGCWLLAVRCTIPFDRADTLINLRVHFPVGIPYHAEMREIHRINGAYEMNTATRMAALAFLLGTLASPVFTVATLAQSPTPCSTCGYRGAPGPIIGAGLPVMVMVGFGVYWLVKRRSKTG
jgi:hypothetical protein